MINQNFDNTLLKILEKEMLKEKLDNQIDQEVYRIYGLTKKEIEIVEVELE